MDAHERLVLNYRFQVLIENQSFSFARISGMGMERGAEIMAEGGNSLGGSLYTVVPRSSRTLRMESGICSRGNSALDNFRPGILLPQGIIIIVLGSDGTSAVKYATDRAFVTKWEVSDLDAEQGKILIDSFEIAYTQFSLLT